MNASTLSICGTVLYELLFDDDLTESLLMCRGNASNSNLGVCFLNERHQHFRLGHLAVHSWDDWIDKYIETDFHCRFRMRKDTFLKLDEVVRPMYPEKLPRGNVPAIGPVKALAITLWYLAHEISMDDVGDIFGVALSTVHKEIYCIVDILCSLKSKLIVWPTQGECATLQHQFQERAGYPGVIGAIDGCHIGVLAPAADQDSYTNRKMCHSIILQGICTASKLFTNVSIGTPGSCNDCRALGYSSFYQKLISEGDRSLFYEDQYHLVGDKAYPLRSWLLTPYRNYGNLTRDQRNYNYKHSVTDQDGHGRYGRAVKRRELQHENKSGIVDFQYLNLNSV